MIGGGLLVAALLIFNLYRSNTLSWKREQELRERLASTPEALQYYDSRGEEHQIKWSEIDRVAWSEPDWGYGFFGSSSYWIIEGKGIYYEIDYHLQNEKKELPQVLFSKHLPNFDPLVVEKAVKAGFFESETRKTLECWRRASVHS